MTSRLILTPTTAQVLLNNRNDYLYVGGAGELLWDDKPVVVSSSGSSIVNRGAIVGTTGDAIGGFNIRSEHHRGSVFRPGWPALQVGC